MLAYMNAIIGNVVFHWTARVASAAFKRFLPSRRWRGCGLIVLELVTQRRFEELADRGLGDLIDKFDRVWQPPSREAGRQEGDQLCRRGGLAGFENDDGERTLQPARIGHGNDRGLGDRRMSHEGVLELDRADPLAARLDQIL